MAVFCQMVQMFMSYDGGATPACLDEISRSGPEWSQAELGLLGSLDKFGMTLSSVLWGRVLQVMPAKLLLVIGLGVNLTSTFAFGNVPIKSAMFAAKFLMGMTQGLQCVWSTCWVLTHAPLASPPSGSGPVRSPLGVGTGIGIAIGGFGTSRGLPYAFAWQVEAAVLGVLWVLLVLCPAASLAIETAGYGETQDTGAADHRQDSFEERTPDMHDIPAAGSCNSAFDEAVFRFQRESSVSGSAVDFAHETRQHSIVKSAECYGEVRVRRTRVTSNFVAEAAVVVQTDALLQLRELARNSLYVWTALVISSIMFVTSGVQFMWARVFMDAWGVPKGVAITSQLVSMGFGGFLGVLVGPNAIDRCGGFLDAEGRIKSLELIVGMMSAAMLGSLAAIAALCAKWHAGTFGATTAPHDLLLGAVWFALFLVFTGFNASLAGLTGINIGAICPSMRSMGSGCTV
eukprot:CAMPEP_0176078712 /NCGR_PEP_ID=MMETSP0120_2-20121206/39363_1 /TAXON_ID=160619 /ORGANISM="Kryptoperidinium foliaceum, Strain CCMP 1326" /LENGTH=457 /DNA_ID=CAMNT_0017412459 /DNA_START=1 /DNA_END=1371 /DNA_ORIENTATION=+